MYGHRGGCTKLMPKIGLAFAFLLLFNGIATCDNYMSEKVVMKGIGYKSSNLITQVSADSAAINDESTNVSDRDLNSINKNNSHLKQMEIGEEKDKNKTANNILFKGILVLTNDPDAEIYSNSFSGLHEMIYINHSKNIIISVNGSPMYVGNITNSVLYLNNKSLIMCPVISVSSNENLGGAQKCRESTASTQHRLRSRNGQNG